MRLSRAGAIAMLILSLGAGRAWSQEDGGASRDGAQGQPEALPAREEATEAPFVDRDGDGIQDGQEHRFRFRGGHGGQRGDFSHGQGQGRQGGKGKGGSR